MKSLEPSSPDFHGTPPRILPLTHIKQFQNVVRLQREIWGFNDVDLLPMRLFAVAGKIGGQVLGAYQGSDMVAFCLCIPGLKPGGKSYLHGHMLGVLPSHRNTGLGRRLKLEQRAFALASEVDLMEWTFDPFELKNAFFNIERLGVVIRRYVHNQYGTTSSHLHGVLPTDRLVAEWWVRSRRVDLTLNRQPLERVPVAARIPLPGNFAALRQNEPEKARAIQVSAAEQFVRHFRAGLAVTGFETTPAGGTYLLSQWDTY